MAADEREHSAAMTQGTPAAELPRGAHLDLPSSATLGSHLSTLHPDRRHGWRMFAFGAVSLAAATAVALGSNGSLTTVTVLFAGAAGGLLLGGVLSLLRPAPDVELLEHGIRVRRGAKICEYSWNTIKLSAHRARRDRHVGRVLWLHLQPHDDDGLLLVGRRYRAFEPWVDELRARATIEEG